MVSVMIKFILVVFFGLTTVFSMAQFGLSGGMSMLKAFGTPKPYVGFHIGAEIPRDDAVSFYGRISFYAKQREAIDNYTYVFANDPNKLPYTQLVPYNATFNYTMIEGGTRYYIGDGYDSGFGAYGGGNFAIILNTVKRKYGDYDQVEYSLDQAEISKGAIFNIGIGLGGGLKHTLAGIGTLYFDANFSYLILAIPSNATASNTNMYAPLLFTFNIGFRKDFF